MHKVPTLMLIVLCAGSVQAVAQHNVPAAQSGHASTYPGQGQPQWEFNRPPTDRSTGGGSLGAADCAPALRREAAERIDPPGPVSESGTASAMVEDSGTLGSTGSTRASSTSGATGTTGEAGSYGADPSGSVTTSGSTGARIAPLVQCDADPASSSGGSGGSMHGARQDDQPAQGQVVKQNQGNTSPSGQAQQMPMQQGR